ncbi:helix-turn-helix domain-containing protein [Nonomuraea aridisoli]|uniref:helix-turn-helix domain-containing protein n=1 Tax=Nonomuraea aridisoli TaxID=2070368 RepID=UPI001F1D2D6C|nr:helix-turn-helix transcriptional regulator [Nonomuraea aridisoli]
MDQRGPVVQGALLRRKLVELRRRRDLTQGEVAGRLEWHPSKLIRIEGGRTAVSRVDLDALMRLYGVTDSADMEKLHLLNQEARAKGWWSDFKNEVSNAYLTYIGFEAGASVIKQFQPLAIPGLLQTPEYAESLCRTVGDSSDLGHLIRLRMVRQENLRRRSSPPDETFVLDEAAIRRHVGIRHDRSIMPAQLRHVIETVECNDKISLRIVPFAAGSHAGMYRGAFTLLSFDNGLGDILHRENGDIQETLTGEDSRIPAFRNDFESLLKEALDTGESLALIAQVAESMA